MKHLILLLVLLLVFPLAHADNKKEIVIFYPDAKPLKQAILIDIMKLVEPRLQYKFVFKEYPWARALEMAKQGQGGITSISKNIEREKIFDYSEVMYVDEILLVTLAEKVFPFNRIEDLKGKTVSSGLAGSYGDEFERGKNTIFTYQSLYGYSGGKTQVGLLKMLLAGRIDVALIGPGQAGLEETISSDQVLALVRDRIVALPKPLVSDPNYLAFSKDLKMTSFLREFNAELAAANKSGAVKKIIETQLKQTSSSSKP